MARVYLKDGRQVIIGGSRSSSRIRGFPAGQNAAVTSLTGSATSGGRQPTVQTVNQGTGQFAPVTNTRLVLNSSFINDYQSSQPFMNVFKTGRRQGGTRTNLDADGYPRSLGSGEYTDWLLLWDLPAAATSLGGGNRYRLWWDGQGAVTVFGRATSIDTSVPGRLEFNVTTGGSGVTVRITSTTSGNHVRNMRCVKLSHLAAFEAGAMFRPEWLRVCGGHHTFRFMNWVGTNGSTQQDWATRVQMTRDTWSGGAPIETMIRLCNETGMRPWFCIPHLATEDFSRRYARLVRDTLNPDLPLTLEYSNETWNFIFDQTKWLQSEAGQITGAGNTGDYWIQYAGIKSAEHMRWWAEEFGPGASRINRTFGVHTGWKGLQNAQFTAPWWVANRGAQRPIDFHDTISITGYMANEFSSDSANRSETLSRLSSNGQSATIDWANAYVSNWIDTVNKPNFDYWFAEAVKWGKKISMYEGGSHIENNWTNDSTLTNFYTALNESAGMATNYEKILALYDSYLRPGDLGFGHYKDIYNPNRYGTWGMVQHEDEFVDEENTKPRHKVLRKYNFGSLGAPATNRTVAPLTGRATALGRSPTVAGTVAPPVTSTFFSMSQPGVHSGHSLTDGAMFKGNWPGHGPNLIDSQGFDGYAAARTSSAPGSPMRYRRVTPPGYGKVDAYQEISDFQILVCTERNDVYPESLFADGGSYVLNSDNRNSRRLELMTWIDRAWTAGNNGNGCHFVWYTCWPDTRYDNGGGGGYQPAASWRERLALNEVEYLAALDWAEANKSSNHPPVRVIPGNALMMRLYDDANAGLNPSVSSASEWLANRGPWWEDYVHPGPYGNLVLAYLHIAVLYGVNPSVLPHTGLGFAYEPNSTVAAYLKNVAWSVATTYPRAQV